MKGKDLFIYALLILFGIGTFASSCKDSDDDPVFPPLDVGDVTSNRILISFTEAGKPATLATFEYYSPNGALANVDTIRLVRTGSGGIVRYESAINFLMDNDTMTAKVEARKESYIVCYRNLNGDNLRVGDFNLDKNRVPLGTTAMFSAVNEGTGSIRITMNYQPTGKEGLCDPGTRIIEAIMPYKITN